MIPCFICGGNTGGGWVKGFPPAPDSQKLGLCSGHNTAANRAKVTDAWRDYLLTALSDLNANNAFKAGVWPRLLNIYFTGGGSISVPCQSFSSPNPEILKVTTPQNEDVFFPMRQVRHYALTPLPRPSAENEPSPAALPEKGDISEKTALASQMPGSRADDRN